MVCLHCDTMKWKSVMCFGLEGKHLAYIVDDITFEVINLNLNIGVPRQIEFPFCPCQGNAITLIKCQYWPGTPLNPKIAFSFELLDMLQALLLECRVAVQDFTQAVGYLIKTKTFKVCL